MARYDFLNRDGEVLLRFDGADAIGPGGWPVSNMIHQPSIERGLREALSAEPGVVLRTRWELSALSQDRKGAVAGFETLDGPARVSARFVVGADGVRSAVRELAGIAVDDLGFDEPWLMVDTLVRNVFRLAYVDLATPALDEARGYYETVLGLQPVEVGADAAYFSLGLGHHNVSLRQAGREGLSAIGLQASAQVSLPELVGRLRDLGFPAELKSDARPGVSSLLEIADVGGHRFQIAADMATAAPGFGKAGVCPLKLGHAAVLSPDPARLLAFLQDGLGFVPTDWFDQLVTFVTCNHDHHVLNVAAAPFATLHHLAFQLGGVADQVRATDFLADREMPTLWGPARHTAGHNIATYHHGADRALIELYNDMDVFSADLDLCEPRPWHGDLPQRPSAGLWPRSPGGRRATRSPSRSSSSGSALPDDAAGSDRTAGFSVAEAREAQRLHQTLDPVRRDA